MPASRAITCGVVRGISTAAALDRRPASPEFVLSTASFAAAPSLPAADLAAACLSDGGAPPPPPPPPPPPAGCVATMVSTQMTRCAAAAHPTGGPPPHTPRRRRLRVPAAPL
eukprot:634228-Pleurochrysis_carterae.AAC.1